MWTPVALVLFWLVGAGSASLAAGVNVALGLALASVMGCTLGGLCLRARSMTPPGGSGATSGWPPLARALARYELAIVLALMPLTLLHSPPLMLVLAVVSALALARWLAGGPVLPHIPMNLPIALLALLLVPGILFAPSLELGLPKATGLVLGIALYAALANLSTGVTARLLARGVAIVGVGAALVGLVGTEWPDVGKLSIFSGVYERLPHWIHYLPSSVHTAEFLNPNEVGGVLTWIVPFLLVWWGGAGDRPTAGLRAWLWQLAILLALLTSSATLFLTQSRAALLAVTLALPLLVVSVLAQRPRGRWFLLLIPVVGLGLGYLVTDGRALSTSLSDDDITAHGRLQIWQQATELISSHAWLGVGLNNFDQARINVVGTNEYGPLRVETHAHNEYLQAALDFGVPGLVAYLALLVSTFGALLRCARSANTRSVRVLAAALATGLLAHQLFGLLDAVTLGAKGGLVWWAYLGVSGWLWAQQAEHHAQRSG
jgi:O-antigen ligase